MKTFIFDLDGTLVNTIYDITDSVNYALDKRGMELVTPEMSVVFVGHGLDDFLLNMVPALVGNEAEFVAFRDDYFSWYSTHYMSKSRPYHGMKELVVELKKRGCKVVMASNKTHEYVVDFNKNVFGGIFDIAVGKKEGIPPKPSVELGDYLMKKLGEKPENCVMVGDSKFDILFAHNCGFYSVAVDWGFAQPGELEAAAADLIVSKAEDILSVCNG